MNEKGQPVSVGSTDGFGALDAMRKERDWWRAKHWNAHHHAHQMFLDADRLRTALEEIMRNTSSPSAVFTIAQRALRGDSPNKTAGSPSVLAQRIARRILTVYGVAGRSVLCTRAQLMLANPDGTERDMGGRNMDCIVAEIDDELSKANAR